MAKTGSRLFGTDGVRGEAGKFPLDPRTIYLLGRALVSDGRSHFVLGRDTRRSGVWIAGMLSRGIESAGGSVVSAGIIPTPGVACLARREDFDAGIVISASHNPYKDNGIKVFGPRGIKLSDDEEDALGERVLDAPLDIRLPDSDPTGDYEDFEFSDSELVGRYVDFLTAVPGKGALEGLNIYLDCAHGAAYQVAPAVFSSLGARVEVGNASPDGTNINDECGALYPEVLAQKVAEDGFDLGAAFDGDADRVILVDEAGKIVDGDRILLILADRLLGEDKLSSGAVVGTVMSNFGLEKALETRGIQLVRTRVGDRYVLQTMLEGGYSLGGEQSGHIIVREHSQTGDGILTTLLVAELLARQGIPLSRLHGDFPAMPQVLMNVAVKEKPDFGEVAEIQDEIEKAEQKMADTGRVLVRYSGTESVVRIMLEGDDAELITDLADDIAAAFKKRLG